MHNTNANERRGLHIERRGWPNAHKDLGWDYPRELWAATADVIEAVRMADLCGDDTRAIPVYLTRAAVQDRAAEIGGSYSLIAYPWPVRVRGLGEVAAAAAVMIGGLAAGYRLAAAAAALRESL